MKMILHSSREGDLVLDPFAGSGSTCKACAELNRNCIGIELDERWIN
jgi:DNA modification methylase